MPNLEVLKQRVDDAERRLHSVQSARERECDALMEMWNQIRMKFQDQAKEIADYRSKLTALQDMNVELASMIDSMLGSIEGSVERSFDHAVPEITGMAKELLEAEPMPETDPNDISIEELEEDLAPINPPISVEIGDTSPPLAAVEGLPNGLSDDPITPEIEPSIGSDIEAISTSVETNDLGEVLELTEPADTEATPGVGIRNLIGRIERAVSRTTDGSGNSAHDDEVDRELEEIEHLRNELNGLRARISATGPAE